MSRARRSEDDLNRLYLTGRIRRNIPFCVLDELCITHGIRRTKDERRVDLIHKLETREVPTIKFPYSKSDYRAMARYVNPEVSWNVDDLLVSYKYIRNFHSLISTKYSRNQNLILYVIGSDEEIRYDPPTPNNRYGFDSIMLYSCCIHCEIECHEDTSPHEMARLLNIFLFGDIERMICRLLFSERFDRKYLLETYLRIKDDSNEKIRPKKSRLISTYNNDSSYPDDNGSDHSKEENLKGPSLGTNNNNQFNEAQELHNINQDSNNIQESEYNEQSDYNIQESESDNIQETESDNIQEIESDNIQEIESDNIQEIESDNIQEIESDNIQEIESDNIQEIESNERSESNEQSESDNIQETESNNIQEPESNNIQEPESNNIQETESNNIQEPESNNIQETESNNIQETESNNIQETESNNIQEPESNNIQETESNNIQEIESNGQDGIIINSLSSWRPSSNNIHHVSSRNGMFSQNRRLSGGTKKIRTNLHERGNGRGILDHVASRLEHSVLDETRTIPSFNNIVDFTDENETVVSIEDIIFRSRSSTLIKNPPKIPELIIRDSFDAEMRGKIKYQDLKESGDVIQSFFSKMESRCRTGRHGKKLVINSVCDMIALTAIVFQIDISGFENPVDEFVKMFLSDPYRNIFRSSPSDPGHHLNVKGQTETHRIELERSNSKISYPDEINLDICFNPNLPKSLYCDNTLRKHAHNYGFGVSEINESDPYELLQTEVLLSTFHEGKMPQVTNERTAISLDDIRDYDVNDLVSYGSITGEMRAYTYEELYDIFNRYKVFQDPASDKGEYFSDRSISKLILILKFPRHTCSQNTCSKLKTDLITLCEEIQHNLRDIDEVTRNFLFKYEQSSERDKESVRELMWIFHQLSMNMRGWLGHGPYPIKDAPVNNQNEVDRHVHESISQLETKIEETGRMGKDFIDLPLIKYKNGVFSKCVNKEDGLTLRKRLDIVKEGDTYNRMSSCIRLTSNWFCSSIYRYMDLIKIDPGFNLDQLSNIG